MNYLTKAGVKFLKEANQKIKLSNLQNLPHPGQGIGKQTGNTNLSRNNPGYEERMEGHQTKMDNRRKVNKKMKRDVNEGSRSLKRLIRKMKAGHIPKGSPSVNQKIKDSEDRHKEAQSGVDPNTRPKNVKGTLASIHRGMEDAKRLPNVLRTTHEFAKSPDPEAEKEYAQSTRTPHTVKAVKRAHSRSVGTFVPGRDQPGTVIALAQQRKEEPTVDKDISDKAKAYRRTKRMKAPPSMN